MEQKAFLHFIRCFVFEAPCLWIDLTLIQATELIVASKRSSCDKSVSIEGSLISCRKSSKFIDRYCINTAISVVPYPCNAECDALAIIVPGVRCAPGRAPSKLRVKVEAQLFLEAPAPRDSKLSPSSVCSATAGSFALVSLFLQI
ncbi:hypothetical protein APHDU1_0110 [Anaplasma phagocytophilum]|nr:hypothetical protein APHDU1_0110 [Anaplasma phagocytophilum]